MEARSPDLPRINKQAFRQRASLDRRRELANILTKKSIMAWERTKCYLCNGEAEELKCFENLQVRCDNCETFYYLTSFVQYFRLKDNRLVCRNPETHKRTHLSNIQKEKLLEFVIEHNDPEGRSSVEINKNLIDSL